MTLLDSCILQEPNYENGVRVCGKEEKEKNDQKKSLHGWRVNLLVCLITIYLSRVYFYRRTLTYNYHNIVIFPALVGNNND